LTGPLVPGHCYTQVVVRWWNYTVVFVAVAVVEVSVGSVGVVLPRSAV